MVKSSFPLRIDGMQVVYSGLAMMQYAIFQNRDDPEALEVLTKTATNFVALYQPGRPGARPPGAQSLMEIPTIAYLKAIGAMEP